MENGWNGLLNALQQHDNPKNNYYVNVSPNQTNKTLVKDPSSFVRVTQVGPNVHPMAEFNMSAWKHMPGSWYQRGQEFRQEMQKAGVGNDTWSLNEIGSGVRSKNPIARNHMEQLVQGLSAADPAEGLTKDKGIVFQQGPGYQQGINHFLQAKKYWDTMRNDVKYYMPENYTSPSRFDKMSPEQRRQYMTQDLNNKTLRHSGPVLSAFWGKDGAYGNTNIPEAKMAKFMQAQMRAMGNRPVYGFSWNDDPANANPALLQAFANTVVGL